jgi:hypothetical protein
MKSILYAGAVLMACACIYGFTEYRTTSGNEGFKEMYTAEKKIQAEPESVISDKQEAVVPVAKVTVPKAEVARKKSIRPAVVEKEVKVLSKPERLDPTGPGKIEKAEVTVTPPEKIVIKKKKKRLNSKMFSRAPIREHQEEVILVPEKKKENVKEAKVSKEL